MPEKPDVVVPVVHLNGTSAKELLELREDAFLALDKARDALCKMAPNGRDYYPDPGRMDKALAQHERRLRSVTDLMGEVETECVKILELTQ